MKRVIIAVLLGAIFAGCATLTADEPAKQAARPHLSPFDDRVTNAVLKETAEVGCDIVSHLDTQVAAISLNGGNNGIGVEIAQPARALLLDCQGDHRILLIKE